MTARYSLPFLTILVACLLASALWPLTLPAHAQAVNGFTSPAPGDVVRGSVQIVGTATLPDFLRYELYFSTNSQDWVYFSGGNVPVIGGVLGFWDTVGANLPDGRYSIRMRVVKADSNYDEYFINGLTVANSAPPTLEATSTPEVETQPDTPTPRPTDESGNVPTPSTSFSVTVELPATRIPVTPTATRAASRATAEGGTGGLSFISTDGLGDAFMSGAKITLYVFAAIAAYLALRDGLRWGIRTARAALYRRQNRQR